VIYTQVSSEFALNFVHKRILRGVGGFLGGGPVGALGGFLDSNGPQQRHLVSRPAPRSFTARPTAYSAAQKASGRSLKFSAAEARNIQQSILGAGDPAAVLARFGASRFQLPSLPSVVSEGCVLPWRRDPRTGECRIFAGSTTGVDPTPVGETVMGQYGPALVPGGKVIDRKICLRGMQLGSDGLCYNKGQIKNSQRLWPRGRQPLLTGGEMRAIGIANVAANRLERTTRRLQKIGMMKKPASRGRRQPAALAVPSHTQHLIASGNPKH